MTKLQNEALKLPPALRTGYLLAHPAPGDEVVITGISGKFPKSNNLYELRDNLFNKIDMSTDSKDRFGDNPTNPKRLAIMPNIQDFDGAFFGMHYQDAMMMDPMCRMSMERTYEAILDAGMNLEEMRGSRTAVFVATDFSESMINWINAQPKTLALTWNNFFTYPQRISYWLGLKGTSMVADTACSSGLFVLELARTAIRNGNCDNAIVIGNHSIMAQSTSVEFIKLGILSNDGRNRSFDKNRTGYTRAEAVIAVLLQKAKNAKRVYAEIVHGKSSCDGFKDHGIMAPSGEMQMKLMKDVYAECNVNPADVSYVEAHATGTQAGDPQELSSIKNVFCENRKDCLLVGSVKSNLGHGEPAAALCSLAKVIVGMENDCIAPNINFETPMPELEEVMQAKKLAIVLEKTKLPGKYLALNSFGFGGANTHVLLKTNMKEKVRKGQPNDDLPRLVCFSGRTQDAVDCFVEDLSSRPMDVEHIRLIQEAFKYHIEGHQFRCYTIMNKKSIMTTKICMVPEKKPQICFMFSGAIKQWKGISASLMSISTFARTIEKIDKILSSTGMNIRNAILDNGPPKEKDPLSTIGVTAVQLALIDVLKVLKIEPDYLIGHSIGQIACAYADNCLTLEQAMMCSYLISHTKTAIELVNDMQSIIASPKKRSKKWLMTMNNMKLPEMCSADYLAQSLISPFVFNKTISKNTMIIEIAPNGPLRDSLKTFECDLFMVPLVDNGHRSPVQVLSKSIGELYLLGYNPRIECLYPNVEFPVSRGTPMISPLIKWSHRFKWHVLRQDENGTVTSVKDFIGTKKVPGYYNIYTAADEWSFVTGHTIDGRVLFPATGYLNLVWEKFCRKKLVSKSSIIFKNVKFIRATHTPAAKENAVQLFVNIQNESGDFEIVESDELVVKGTVRIVDDAKAQKEMTKLNYQPVHCDKTGSNTLIGKDIYKEFRLRGYHYRGIFRGLHSCNIAGTIGQLRWNNNIIAFMDTVLQMALVHRDTRLLYVPTGVDTVVINYKEFRETVENLAEDETVPVYYFKDANIIKSAGIEIRGIKINSISKRKPLGEPVLESYKFLPNIVDNLTLEESVRAFVQVALENVPKHLVQTVEVLDADFDSKKLLSPMIQAVLGDLPLIQADINVLTKQNLELPGITVADRKLTAEKDALLVVITDGLKKKQMLGDALNAVVKGGFVVTRESGHVACDVDGIEVILEYRLANETVMVLRRTSDKVLRTSFDFARTSHQLNWLPALQQSIEKDPSTVVHAQGDDLNGIIGMINCLRKEPGKEGISCVFVLDKDVPKFDLRVKFYAEQLRKGLAINVYKNGAWGTYRHLLLKNPENVACDYSYVDVTVPGDLSSIRWVQGSLQNHLDLSKLTLAHVYYSALNFRDVMLSTGRISLTYFSKNRFAEKSLIGFEYSGCLKDGRRIMGSTLNPSISNLVYVNPLLTWEIPDGWSLEDAATVPIIYTTVIYCFLICCNIQKGQSVLIHAGSGGVGQAAINIALSYGLKVYTTVGTREKREFIKATWPEIKDNQIGNSRDTSFEEMIMTETNGRGVDYVLNSLSEEKLLASMRCLSKGGHFMEIGKFDITKENPLALEFIRRGMSFHGCHLENLYSTEGTHAKMLWEMFAISLRNGLIKPIARKVFSRNEVEGAFRFMGAGKHIGKILIKVRDEDKEKVVIPKTCIVEANPRYIPTSTASYILCGGLGGFGLELADWLVLKGARNIVLNSRRGVSNSYQSLRINVWRNYGVSVRISTADVTTLDGCKKLIEEASELGEVEGIFNLAVILRDAIFENQTVESFETSFGPKAVATKHLDLLSRKLCSALKCFVIFSSVSCGRGNAGQTNYGMANSIMERICERRKRDGYPALAVEWGAVGDVGLVAEMQENNLDLEIAGTLLQSISNCLSVMEQFMTQNETIVSSMVVAEKRAAYQSGGSIVAAIANILGIYDLNFISFQSTLPELGMDSITAVEINQTLERDFDMSLSPREIRALTLEKLQELTLEENKPRSSAIKKDQFSAEKYEMFVNLITNEESEKNPVVILPSATTSKTRRKCILIPGVEGLAASMSPVAESLEAHSICLQINSRVREPDISKTAEVIYKESFQKYDLIDDNFTIVAHSFGVLLALELATLLEQNGKVGHVVCVDGAPDMLKEFTRHVIPYQDVTTFRNDMIHAIVLSLAGSSNDTTLETLEKQSSWDEKIKYCYENLPKDISASYEYMRKSCETAYTKIIAGLLYKNRMQLESKIKLIKPTHPVMTYPEDDYGLSSFTKHPVEIVTVPGSHFSMLSSKECAKEINLVLRVKM